jgi:hypothetical protein
MTLFEGGPSYDGAQVFSATKPDRREKLGEAVTDWLQAHPERVPVRVEVRQRFGSPRTRASTAFRS